MDEINFMCMYIIIDDQLSALAPNLDFFSNRVPMVTSLKEFSKLCFLKGILLLKELKPMRFNSGPEDTRPVW